MDRRLLLVDGSNLLFQMFFGMPSRIVDEQGKAIQGTLGFVGALRVLEYDRREMDTGEVLRGIGLRGAGEASGPGGTLRACRICRKALWQNETMISI